MASYDRQHRGTLLYLWWWVIWTFWLVAGWIPFRPKASGTQQLPRQGPFLILPNHTSMFDPFWVAHAIVKPTWFMASAQVFRIPVLGTLLGSLGTFPKMKFVKDRAAMGKVQELHDAHQRIMIFPEGERSWDGRTTPVLPGIGRLIQRLDTPVVFARVLTGHLFHPRWATYPRWVPIQVDFSEPVRFPPEATPEQITREVDRRIQIRPDIVVDAFTFGWRMAWGLPGYLWACPSCLAPNALEVDPRDGNAVRCTACLAGWRLSTSSQMTPTHDNAAPLSVSAAYDIIQAHFGSPPVLDRQRYEEDGVILECDTVQVGRILKGHGTRPQTISRGRLVLTAQGVQAYGQDQQPTWSLDWQDVLAVSMEFQDKLQLRTTDALFQIDPTGQSRSQWCDYMRPWWSLARTGSVDGWLRR